MDVKDGNGTYPQEHDLIAAAVAEVTKPTFGVTEQFLEVHSVALENGQPKVVGLNRSADGQQAAVYFAVAGEKFYLAVYLGLLPHPRVQSVDTEDYYQVSFLATSASLSLPQLSALTTLQPTASWNKGEQRGGTRQHHHCGLEFQASREPNTLDNKLNQLLDVLEQDSAGVQALADEGDGIIQVLVVFHNGNTALGGVSLDKQQVHRLAALKLEIDFDLYAEGKSYQEDS